MFDTKVQYLKYCALREIAKASFSDTVKEEFYDIPKRILPGYKATTRCCIYKERAIFSERLKLALGGNREDKNVIHVIDIACEDCPASGYTVTEHCRGCIAHRCKQACKMGAIHFDDKQKAHIDKSKCINCGACAKACQYSAIINNIRPCENACKLKAITMGDNHSATIDRTKCISCGACVYQCPFGAISDKSFIVDVVKMLKESNNNENYKMYAIVAPSISSQFDKLTLGQVVTGIKQCGFFSVIETALGADMVANKESLELVKKGFLTSSCCPAFVSYIKQKFPNFIEHISSNLSPMAELGKWIKTNEPTAKVVFIGPCTAKKMEFQQPEVSSYIDSVLTFEELQALFDSLNINLEELSETVLDNASYFGRIFARSGGLKDAVQQAIIENKIENFAFKPVVCNGIEECKINLLKIKKKIIDNNFVEGMACVGGCIGGPCCITHGPKDANAVDQYGKLALEKSIKDAIRPLSKL